MFLKWWGKWHQLFTSELTLFSSDQLSQEFPGRQAVFPECVSEGESLLQMEFLWAVECC